MYRLAGTIFDGDTEFEGYVEVEDGIITNISRGPCQGDALVKGLIIPAPINAHVHLGDAFITERPPKDLDEAVKPPHGWKHRKLAEASEQQIMEGMERCMATAFDEGTCHLVDFREGGLEGIDILEKARAHQPIGATVLGRPSGLEYDGAEIRNILDKCDGLGISGVMDWDPSGLRKVARDCHAADKVLALHTSEKVREDIEKVLELEPDLLVHMCAASRDDLLLCKEEGVPLVSCPTSNSYFGFTPVLKTALECGLEPMLGTDNAMITGASILRELWVARDLLGDIDRYTLLGLITTKPRKNLKRGDSMGLEEGSPIEVAVYGGPDDDVRSLVDGSIGPTPHAMLIRDRIWRNDDGELQEDADTH